MNWQLCLEMWQAVGAFAGLSVHLISGYEKSGQKVQFLHYMDGRISPSFIGTIAVIIVGFGCISRGNSYRTTVSNQMHVNIAKYHNA
ncbi:hypothetical protein ACSS6W_010632 [Trichoderma asperelloides]|nr:hypothetical protein LI328DRAFT_137328 [Trichoderma asperelloides]